jgi:succinoglycan biosynthesis transport protein ExoP
MEEDLKLRDVLEIVRRRRRLIITVVACGMAAAMLFLMSVTPRYTAEATLKFDPRQFQITSENKNVGPELFERLIAGEIAVMRSPELVEKVVIAERLDEDGEFTSASAFDRLRGLFTSSRAGAETHLQNRVRERVLDSLVVEQPARSNLIAISFTSEDAVKAARIANAITTIYLTQHLENRLGSSPLASRWLGDRKETLRDQWRASEQAAEDFKAKNNLNFAAGANLKEQHIGKLNEQMIEAAGEVEETRANVEQIRRLIKAQDFTQLTNVVQSDVMTRLRERHAITAQRQASMATALMANHPQMKQINSEMRSVRAHIAAEGKRMLENLEVEFRSKRDREKLIKANMTQMIDGQQRTSEVAVKLRELEKNAASDKAIYEAFLNRSNETLEQSSGDFANFQLIKKAQVPLRPSFPSKLKVLLLGLVGSLMAGLGAAFLLEALFDRFRTKSHVTSYLDLPHLATMPELKGADFWTKELARRPERLIAFNPSSAFGRAAGGLRVALGLRAPKGEIKTLAVCSAREGEGKTMVAAAIAQHAALQGQKALLMDCDFRTPALADLFEASIAAEPIDISGPTPSVSSPLMHDAVTGLDVMPILSDQANAATFLNSEEFADMLASAKKAYDLVVIDTGALDTSPETWVVASMADASLLVVEWNKTRRETAAEAVRQLIASNATPIGVVLNRADAAELAEAGDSAPLGRFPTPAFGRRREAPAAPQSVRPFGEGLFGGAGE